MIERFTSVAREIFALDDVILFEMVHLECHDIKQSLVAKANSLAGRIVGHLAQVHTDENNRSVYFYACLYPLYLDIFVKRVLG